MADTNEGRLRCGCGAQVLADDILVTAYEMRAVGPDYLYVKYLCSRCGRMGEHRIEQPPVRRAAEDAQPPISPSEVDAFHQALGRPDALARLVALGDISTAGVLDDGTLTGSGESVSQ